MKNVYIVMKNTDFTEGRGPMRLHKVFSSFEEAEKYVMRQEGIYGSEQERSSYGNYSMVAVYNGYDIETFEVYDADLVSKEEQEKQEAKKVAKQKQLRANALSKLSAEERAVLGIKF